MVSNEGASKTVEKLTPSLKSNRQIMDFIILRKSIFNDRFLKSLTMPKQNSNGDPLGFFNIQNSEKIKGGTFGDIFSRKILSHNAEKSQTWDPSVSPGIICYPEKPFRFCSLGQMVQFDTMKFYRTQRTTFVTSGTSKKH